MSALLVSVFSPDRTGLVAAIAGRLFELGGNLGDTSFAALGSGAEFTSVCTVPDDLTPADVETDLKKLPELTDAVIDVSRYEFSLDPGPGAQVTHTIVVSGGDRPGLIARLAEVFVEFKANIVRMDARRIPDANGGRLVTRFAVSIPDRNVASCLSTVANTAGELNLTFHAEEG